MGARWYDYVTNASLLTRTGQPPLTTTICKRRLGAFGHIICRLQPGTQAIDILASIHLHHGAALEDAHHSTELPKITNDNQLTLSDCMLAIHGRPSWRSDHLFLMLRVLPRKKPKQVSKFPDTVHRISVLNVHYNVVAHTTGIRQNRSQQSKPAPTYSHDPVYPFQYFR